MKLTQQRLKEVLDYDVLTGEFVWANPTASRIKAGTVAGTVKTNAQGKQYVQICIDKVCYYADRLAFLFVTGEFPEKLVAHLNGDTLDNSWENLFEISPHINACERSLSTRNALGHKGVSFEADHRKPYRAKVFSFGVVVLDEYFETLEAAVAAATTARKQFHCEFANHG